MKKIYRNPLFITLITFGLAFLLIGFKTDFPVNDDWLFVRQVEAFSKSIFTINKNIEPSFIFQGLMGLVWGSIFGFTFVSMHFLTFMFAISLITGIYMTLRYFNLDDRKILLVLLTVAFNPLIFSSTVTFMTEIYFLGLMVWSLYFFIRYLDDPLNKFLLLGALISSLAFLVRQTGIVLFIAMSMALVFKVIIRKEKRALLHLVTLLLVGFLAFLIWYLWPTVLEADSRSLVVNPGKYFIEPKLLRGRINELPLLIPSIAFFLSPITLGVWMQLKGKRLLTAVHISYAVIIAWLTTIIFKLDIFPVGSVFYLEELHAKSGFKSDLSLFDNIGFKLFMAVFVATSVVSLLATVAKLCRTRLLLSLCFFGYFCLLILSKDFYDRYALPLIILLLLGFSDQIIQKKITFSFNFWAKLGLGLIVLLTVFLNWEFMVVQKIKWQQAYILQEGTGLKTQIFLDGTYTKYTRANEKNDYLGLISSMPPGLEYKCYVQQYTEDKSNLVFSTFKMMDDILDKRFDNPKVYERKKLEVKKIKKHLDELLINEEYFSPIYTIIGKKAYVGSWCEPEVDFHL